MRNGDAEHMVDETARAMAESAHSLAGSAIEYSGTILRELQDFRNEVRASFETLGLNRRAPLSPVPPPSRDGPLPSLADIEPDEITQAGRTQLYYLHDSRGRRVAVAKKEDLTAMRTGKMVRKGAGWLGEKLAEKLILGAITLASLAALTWLAKVLMALGQK